MATEMITITKDELSVLIRGIVKEELNKIGTVSDSEQKELEDLYGSSLSSNDYNKKDCIRL